MARDAVLSRPDIEAMVARGDAVVIFQDHVLRLNSWLHAHPGGALAIRHMVGRDATSEMTLYHTSQTLKTVKAFRIGRKPAGPWTNMTPPIRATATDPDPDALEPKHETPDHHHDAHLQPASSHMSRRQYTDWALGQLKDADKDAYPPAADLQVQLAITEKYMALHREIEARGLYECRYGEYAKELARCLALLAASVTLLPAGWYLTSAFLLGLFWHQIMFTAHDAGHRAITRVLAVDTLIGMLVADLCCGLSIGWWKSSHNVHHLVTNQPAHDPDIQNVPLFATCPSFFRSLRSSYYGVTFAWDRAAELLVPWQKYTYYPVMAIARFNLYLLSWIHVLIGPSSSSSSSSSSAVPSSSSSSSSSKTVSSVWWVRPAEIACMAGYWLIFGYLLLIRTLPDFRTRVAYVLISHAVTMPLHVQITLSHWGMSTANLGEDESFPQRQLRTTMDVDCPAWLDFVHGGLQFQAVHHLFPRVPRHNLRAVQGLVRRFCRDTGIPYAILGFADGNRKVLGRLDDVGRQVRILIRCQKYMAETGESGLH